MLKKREHQPRRKKVVDECISLEIPRYSKHFIQYDLQCVHVDNAWR